jgi:hemolysin activation/secretion protein
MADGASWLANLGQSMLGPYWQSSGIPRDAISIYDDWGFVLRLMGQAANQPLVPTEQYAAGGVGTVRGYLQSEVFGDDAWNTNVELWTRRFSVNLAPSFPISWRTGAFWDLACMYNLAPGEGESTTKCIQGIGLGFELFVVPWITSQVYLADPLNSTSNTQANQLRVHLRFTGGF